MASDGKFSPPYSRGCFCAATTAREVIGLPSGSSAPKPRRPRPGSARRRAFAPQPYRLPGPKIGKIDPAELFRRRFQRRQGGSRHGEKSGHPGEIGPTSRITRLATPRAGRPVITLVITVASSGCLGQRHRAGALTLDSGQRR